MEQKADLAFTSICQAHGIEPNGQYADDLYPIALAMYQAASEEQKPSADYTTCQVQYAEGGNAHYTFRCLRSQELKQGDLVIVESPRSDFGFTLARIWSVHDTPEDKGPYAYKWIAKKFDTAAYIAFTNEVAKYVP